MASDIPQIPPHPNEHTAGLVIAKQGFELSEELEAVADELIHRHANLHHLDLCKLGYMLEYADLPAGGKYCDWAKARLVPKWVRPIAPYDAAITVNAMVWQVLADKHREALMLHELLHIGLNEKGAWEIVPHDVEEFGFVVREYGQWRPSLTYFAEQLGLGLPNGNG